MEEMRGWRTLHFGMKGNTKSKTLSIHYLCSIIHDSVR